MSVWIDIDLNTTEKVSLQQPTRLWEKIKTLFLWFSGPLQGRHIRYYCLSCVLWIMTPLKVAQRVCVCVCPPLQDLFAAGEAKFGTDKETFINIVGNRSPGHLKKGKFLTVCHLSVNMWHICLILPPCKHIKRFNWSKTGEETAIKSWKVLELIHPSSDQFCHLILNIFRTLSNFESSLNKRQVTMMWTSWRSSRCNQPPEATAQWKWQE